MARFGEGNAGYTGYSQAYKAKRKPRGRKKMKFRKAKRFAKRVMKVVQQQNKQKYINSILNPSGCTFKLENANTDGKQVLALVCTKLAGYDVAQINANIEAVAGILDSNVSKIGRWYLDSFRMQLMFKNQAQTSCIVDLYCVVPRTANLTNPVTELTNIDTQQGGADLTTLWGFTPFECGPWCENYKIISIDQICLAPGAPYLYTYRDRKQKIVDNSKYYTANTSYATSVLGVPKLTMYWIAIARGEPIHDRDTTTNINTSNFSVDVIARTDYRFSYNFDELDPRVQRLDNRNIVTNGKTVLEPTGAVVQPPVDS